MSRYFFKLLANLACICLLSCSSVPPRMSVAYHGSEAFYDYYIAKFERVFGIKVPPSVTIQTQTTPFPITKHLNPNGRMIAKCDLLTQQIHVYRAGIVWPDSIETTIFHELGHCVLGLNHIEVVSMTDGCPKSVMNPSSPGAACYNKYKQWYYKELKREFDTFPSHVMGYYLNRVRQIFLKYNPHWKKD